MLRPRRTVIWARVETSLWVPRTVSRPLISAFAAGRPRGHHIELRSGLRAEKLDPAAHTVTVATGERLDYDKLLLTTGWAVLRLAVPGVEIRAA
jgi:NADPH-dependent 2,4-dienoyl-CoA reductase/sulfur reductase-like enzyme